MRLPNLTSSQLYLAVCMGTFLCEIVRNLHRDKCLVHPDVVGL